MPPDLDVLLRIAAVLAILLVYLVATRTAVFDDPENDLGCWGPDNWDPDKEETYSLEDDPWANPNWEDDNERYDEGDW